MTACIALWTLGRPYPYWRSKPGLPVQPVGGLGLSAMSEEVARTTWMASSFVSGEEIWCSAAACFAVGEHAGRSPRRRSASTPRSYRPMVATENMLWVPQEV